VFSSSRADISPLPATFNSSTFVLDMGKGEIPQPILKLSVYPGTFVKNVIFMVFVPLIHNEL